MVESTSRVAWKQYRDQGKGNGLNASKDKQTQTLKGGVRTCLQTDYFVKSKGFEATDDLVNLEKSNAK